MLAINVAQTVSIALQKRLGENLVSIVLYGSRARGDAHENSDWDFLVIAHELPKDAFDRHISLKGLLPTEVRGIASVLARTPNEFETAFSALYLDIAADGKILFDHNYYIKNKLKAIQELTRDSGFIRQRGKAGDLWLNSGGKTFQPLSWPNKIHSHARQ